MIRVDVIATVYMDWVYSFWIYKIEDLVNYWLLFEEELFVLAELLLEVFVEFWPLEFCEELPLFYGLYVEFWFVIEFVVVELLLEVELEFWLEFPVVLFVDVVWFAFVELTVLFWFELIVVFDWIVVFPIVWFEEHV